MFFNSIQVTFTMWIIKIILFVLHKVAFKGDPKGCHTGQTTLCKRSFQLSFSHITINQYLILEFIIVISILYKP